MPTYEYECDACSHRFEMIQRMSDSAIRKCPKCRKLKVRRLISGGAGLIFKGSGFYITDYRDKRPGAAPRGDGDGASQEPRSSESKPSETKSSGTSPADSSGKSSEKAPAKADAKPHSKSKPGEGSGGSRSSPKKDGA